MFEPVVHSHWHQSIPGLVIVPSEFYAAVEAAVTSRNIPGIKVSRVKASQGAILSAQREYVRVQRGEYFFDICGAPFADGSFVSWWLAEDLGCAKGCFTLFPVVGWLMIAFIFRDTYYKVDTRLMFQDAVHASVLEVVDGLTSVKGVRGLADYERVPSITRLLK